CAGVQRGRVGPDGVAAPSRHRRLCPWRQRQARQRPDLRRRRAAAGPAPLGGRAHALVAYAAPTVESAWLPRSLFSGTNLLAVNVAHCGTVLTVIRTHGASNGGTTTWPPSAAARSAVASASSRSEEHTSELQSRGHLVCRLLLEKK